MGDRDPKPANVRWLAVLGSAIEIDAEADAALDLFENEFSDDDDDVDPGPFPLRRALEKAYRCGFAHAQHRAAGKTGDEGARILEELDRVRSSR